ncbi:hypothetical protein H310_13876 [Aphanomyces invadans]|uniref:Mitochondrial carrier protein n=1 Tax=Aphanomyces invadans TaxID=157072 RepID=A0A024TE45_9STRA|nr:hypothetical protein H310_13876 [Aphanomyces invadans]ETV91627.1 hypothetical protein H310_13876 [Aphanomyces invadans]|eukprot:XP_008879746.1 hypothetical protein H310_13876 [Aphanomyces invadans]
MARDTAAVMDVVRANAPVLAGAISGAATATISNPLDVAKTRIQVQGGIMTEAKYTGIFRSVHTIYVEEGLRGMYRGYSAALCSFPVYWSLYFPTYEFVKVQLNKTSLDEYPVVIQGLSATITGTTVDIATYPLWFLRTRMHTQHLHQITSSSHARDNYSTLRSTVATIFKREGPEAFFKGLSASCFGILSYGIQFPVYEYLKHQVAIDPDTQKPSAIGVVLAATVSKAIAASFSYPGDVVRTRMQDQMGKSTYKHFADAMVQIARKEGVGSLYAGFRVNIFRILPQCATTFFVYEHVKSSIEAQDVARLPFRRFTTSKPMLQ